MESARHIIVGKNAENMAAMFFSEKGYQIVSRNYRYRRGEIDLIVQKDNLLVFVEVKYRKSVRFGFPEEAVNSKKMELLQTTAEEFIFNRDWNGDIRFDIIAIDGNNNIAHFQDVF
ncbi:YraN family protein [Cytophagaceae bacterium ABcell3]|nr:YraN family protein [Cytophagaceae bacterium ABcell3]